MSEITSKPIQLDRTLGPVTLWGLGVGYVISGMYFGWNLGLPRGGTLGLAISTFFVAWLYIFFTLSYCELACAIPKAGGGFDYAQRALGSRFGILTGVTQWIEFVFAPPAIAYAIGAYFHEFVPGISVEWIAGAAFVIFTALNIWGVRAAARFELFVTVFAVLELLVFSGVALPHLKVANLVSNALPHGWVGIFASVPFAIWFFLGIEGVANVAEETIDPQRNVVLGFGTAMMTLIVLCALTFVAAVGVAGWEAIVYPTADLGVTSDSPLPLALSHIVGKGNWLYHMLLTIGLFGLVASFHGLLLAAGRVTYELGKAGYLPSPVGQIHPRFKTPVFALLANMVVGILALLTGKTGEIIVIACFGALVLYILSFISFFKLRIYESTVDRPFLAPGYPWAPASALVVGCVALIAMVVFNSLLAAIYFVLMIFGYFALSWTRRSVDFKTRSW